MDTHESIVAGGSCERSNRGLHRGEHSVRVESDGFMILPVDHNEPDESLFAREVEIHRHEEPERIESFPENRLVM
jgi:hypothetical protein